jgi:hypothetical protein
MMISGDLHDNFSPTDPEENGFRQSMTIRVVTLLLLFQAAGILLITKEYFNLYILFSALLNAFFFLYYKNLKIGTGLVRMGFLLYFAWLLLGLTNQAFLIDLKYHLAWLLTFLLFANFFSKISDLELIRYLLLLNVLLFVVYLLLFTNVVPNLYVVDDIPDYQAFRTFGPVVVSFYAFCMVMNYPRFRHWPKRNLFLFINLAMGVIVAILQGSLQNFAILALIYLLTFFRRQQLARFLLVLSLAIGLFSGAIWTFGTEPTRDKFQELLNPFQSPTVLTRVADLAYMLDGRDNAWQILAGRGLGVTSEVFRVSPRNDRLVEFREFLEIDNGFYYVYHRAGLIGLALFLLLHVHLLRKYGNSKNRMSFLAFFVITNALSIHYFTNPMSSLMCYLLVRQKDEGVMK